MTNFILMTNFIRMRLDETVFQQSRYLDDPVSLTSLLQKGHKLGLRATCLCSPNFPELYIAHRGSTFYLAKMPETGSMHDAHCVFYETPSSDSGRSLYTDGVIVDKDGIINVKLNVPLAISRETAQPSANVAVNNPNSKKRHAIELLGLLHLIWEYSNNNRWFPVLKDREIFTRSWSSAHYFIEQTVAKIEIKNKKLNEHLYAIPSFNPKEPDVVRSSFERAFEHVVRSGSKEARDRKEKIVYKMVLGEIKEIVKSKYGYALKFKHLPVTFFMKDALFEKVNKSYQRAISSLENDQAVVVAIILVSASQSGAMQIEAMAPMQTSKQYIPFDSSYELRVANDLVSQSRQFEKPLRYDSTELTLPDFILCDAKDCPRIPFEIYGMTGNAEYDSRKLEKRRIYKQQNTTCWEWEPALQANPPAFPQKRAASREPLAN